MALFKAVVWALIFLTKLRFPPGVSIAISLVRSDHQSVLIPPHLTTKPVRKNVIFRDVREHRKVQMDRKSQDYNGICFLIVKIHLKMFKSLMTLQVVCLTSAFL